MTLVARPPRVAEEQRHAAARQARAAGVTPSVLKETTGASKQRARVPRHAGHDEKQAAVHQGKQDWEGQGAAAVPPPEPPLAFESSGREYTAEHEKVFSALAAAQDAHQGEGVYPDELARACDMPQQRIRELLHDLSAVFRLVTQLHQTDTPDLGPRYEVKPRL